MPLLAERPLGAVRDRAEHYVLVTIVAFALTVAGVRWYLDIAGYPTIGGGDIHIAHVLWGGLLLIVAALLPILFVGRRSLLLSAALAGVGVGLFIDEVGKFVTTSNDYFFAPAAPIIYGSVLLLVLLWFMLRRRSWDAPLDATQAAVEALRDSVDGKLTAADRGRVLERLERIMPGEPGPGGSVEEVLARAIRSPAVGDRLAQPGWIARGDARALLERLLPTRLLRVLILIGLAWTMLQAVVAFLVLIAWDQIIVGGLVFEQEFSGPIEIPSEPVWSLLLLAISIVVGAACAVAIVLILRKRERAAMRVALMATLIALIAGDLVAIYAFQIAALASVVGDVLQLGFIVDYRIRLDRKQAADVVDAEHA